MIVRRLAQVKPDGADLATGDLTGGGARAVLHDLYLVPGEHVFAVRAAGDEYALQATPLGPPDPDGEREPNGDPTMAERYRIGSRRVGRLPDRADHDFMRMTVAAPQRVMLRLTPPADASIGLRLWVGGEAISRR